MPYSRSESRRGKSRIAVISSYTISLTNFRYRLLAAMVERGYEVVAFGPEYDPAVVDRLDHIGVTFMQIPMERAGFNPFTDIRTLLGLYVALRRVKPDIVLSYTMKPIIYGLMAARMAGISQRHALVTGLGYVFGSGADTWRRRLLRKVASTLYRIALAGTGKVFVYNGADEHDIRADRMVADTTRIVRVAGSGVDLKEFPSEPVPQGPVAFLMVARLLRDKGVFEFADAARRLHRDFPHARFQLLGRSDPGPSGIGANDIEEWRQNGPIDYLGETDDVRPYLSAAAVFVLPSYYREGIPRSILEAMAVGRPIITTDLPGCRDTVVEGDNGFLVPPRDADELTVAMKRFLTDPGLAAEMGARSRALAEERFDVEAVNRVLLDAMAISPARGS
ncbi:glycosyltransferase family 4 protein [Pararhizobium mangrovi]|uniref:Glycosyltransferase family 4 protein n=1 Tax=Pararhizobium mangrovi TaxID=2590452 RepID=A0A506U7W4_9HYPH|nr:glycosyltransferase family 4 protein [Pararhizobium mangrovi]TPW29045.1 glycosyltransferase family 4 protein [Pararhizobium mangrovi]